MAWIEGVPVSAKVSLEPRTEIHRVGDRRDADITEIAGSVTCRNIHAAAECYRQMREIAADANPLVKGIERRAVSASFEVIELEMAMDKIANRLHPSPTRWRISEGSPGKIKQFAIDLAVTAGEKERQGLQRDLTDVVLGRFRGVNVQLARVANDGLIQKTNHTSRRVNPAAAVAKSIEIFRNRKFRLDPEALRLFEVIAPGRMNVEHTDDCGRERKAKGNVVTDPDTHMTPALKERVRTH